MIDLDLQTGLSAAAITATVAGGSVAILMGAKALAEDNPDRARVALRATLGAIALTLIAVFLAAGLGGAA